MSAKTATAKQPPKNPFSMTTLGELGAQLPIGIGTPDGRLLKDFKLKPFRFKEERDVEKLKEKRITMGRFVSGLLGILVEEVAGLNVQKMSDAERLLHFSQMWMGDVMYLYVFLRVQALGNVLPMKLPCKACGLTFDFDGDLNGTDVRVVEKPEEIYSQVTLAGGLPYLGEPRRTLTTRPVTWGNFEDRDINDPGAVKLAMFQGSIVGVDGVPKDKMAVIPETSFDELTKRDVEVLTRHLEQHTPGPQMLVEAACPSCKIEWMFPIRWGYDDFFGISSL